MKITKKKRKSLTILLLTIIILGILGIIFVVHTMNEKKTITSQNSPISGKIIEGNQNASITIVEFSDYECPYCQRFYKTTYQQIKKEYIDTGKANLIFKSFPLNIHKNSEKAAEAALCAGEQGKYYEMYNMLFENGAEGGITQFKEYAKKLDLNKNAFNTCLDSGIMQKTIQKSIAQGKKLGVTGTPTFFINGQMILGAQPLKVFEQKINSILKEQNQSS